MTKRKRRTRGTGRVYKVKRYRNGEVVGLSKFWYLRYYSTEPRITKSGKQTFIVTESSGSTSREVAEKMLRERLSRKDRGERVLDPRRVTFSDLEQMILADYEKDRKDPRRLKIALTHLRRVFEHDRATDITTDRWTTYVTRRQRQSASASSIMNERAALSRMFTLAVNAQRLHFKPAFPGVRLDNVREKVLADDEVLAILRELPPDIADAIEFMWYVGWRTGEVLPLRWNQIDRAEGVIRWEVGSTKNRRGLTLAYDAHPQLATLIRRRRKETDALEHKQERTIKWVFSLEGQQILHKRFYKQWHAAVLRAAYRGEGEVLIFPNLLDEGKDGRPIPHDLRRSFIVRCERAGVARSVATAFTGHQTESVYTRYAIARLDEQREALAKVAASQPKRERT